MKRWDDRQKWRQIGEEFMTADAAEACDYLQDIIPRSQLETVTTGIDVINVIKEYCLMEDESVPTMIMKLIDHIGNGKLRNKVIGIIGNQLRTEEVPSAFVNRSPIVECSTDECVCEVSMPVEETGSQLCETQSALCIKRATACSSSTELECLQMIQPAASTDSMILSIVQELDKSDYFNKGKTVDIIDQLFRDKSVQLESQLCVMLGAEGPAVSLNRKFETYMQEV